jgi:hypothetical protein
MLQTPPESCRLPVRNRYRKFESTSLRHRVLFSGDPPLESVRGFEFISLRQRVSGLRHSPGKCANCARVAAIARSIGTGEHLVDEKHVPLVEIVHD